MSNVSYLCRICTLVPGTKRNSCFHLTNVLMLILHHIRIDNHVVKTSIKVDVESCILFLKLHIVHSMNKQHETKN